MLHGAFVVRRVTADEDKAYVVDNCKNVLAGFLNLMAK